MTLGGVNLRYNHHRGIHADPKNG